MARKNTCEDFEESSGSSKRVKKTKQSEKRRRPNILITGTPGTGKSTLCKKLHEISGVKVINVGEFAKENDCLGDFDMQYECHEMDEDKLIDELEDIMAEGDVALEHHVTDLFPERWFDVVFVLRTDNTILYDRLKARDYNQKKLDDNIQCEIFQTILDEAKESYDPEIVHEIKSDGTEDIERNAKNINAWIEQWVKDNQ